MNASPHTPLYSQKSKIIARLKEFLAQAVVSQEIATITFELGELDLWQLLPYIDHPQKVFFGDREGTTQYLGIKFLRTFNSTFALENARHLIDENKELVILGGQRFHPNRLPAPEWSELGSHYYVIPQFLFVCKNGQCQLRINIPDFAILKLSENMRLLLDVENLFSFKGHQTRKLSFESSEEVPNFNEWQKNIDLALLAFKSDELQKVVLSRKKILSSEKNIRPDDVLHHLPTTPGEHFIFHLQWRSDRAFTSVTPERLFKLDGNVVISDAIAGTRVRGENEVNDKVKAFELKNSSKELAEHRFVTNALIKTMQELKAKEINVIGDAENIMRLTHVQHLHTRLGCKLEKDIRTNELINAFHPTPAVGGTPKIDASDWLSSHEAYDRGFYAAPMGVIDSSGADFCVAIRSALIYGRELHIYAGAGIVSQSEAKAEWDETANKMRNFNFKTKLNQAPRETSKANEQTLN